MVVFYNNEKLYLEEKISLLELIESRESIEHKAVWLNGEHVRLRDFTKILNENDHVKVVRIRGGG